MDDKLNFANKIFMNWTELNFKIGYYLIYTLKKLLNQDKSHLSWDEIFRLIKSWNDFLNLKQNNNTSYLFLFRVADPDPNYYHGSGVKLL